MSADWTAKPFSIMGHVFDHWLLPTDPAEVARFKRRLSFDAEHWLGSDFCAGGDNGKSFLFKTRHGSIRDDLADYLPAAHAEGIKVLVYLNVHWFGDAFGEEMFARTAAGEKMTAYGHGALTCPAGPFLDFCLALAEDLGAYAIDGVFLDGPYGSICWCEHCRRAYAQKFGEPMPEAATTLAIRRRLHEWAAEKVAHFVDRFRATLRAKQPEAIVYHNADGLGRLTWTNRAAIEVEDLLGIEGGFLGYRPLTGQFLYKTTAAGKLLDCLAGGKPTVIFCDHGFKKYDYHPLPRPELELMYAATLATGANPWYLLFCRTAETHAADVARSWNRFIGNYAGLLAGARPAETAALLFSDSTSLVATSAKAEADSIHAEAETQSQLEYRPQGDPLTAFEGAYALLTRSAIPFRIVTEKEVAAGLDGIDLLIAPSVSAIEAAAFAGLERFVARGGTLLADDEFAVLDEHGHTRSDDELGALLGAVRTGAIEAAAPNLDYIAAGKGWLFKGIPSAPIPRPERAFKVKRTGGRARAYFHKPLSGRYGRMTDVSRRPAVLEHTLGDGHVFYLPMNLFEHYRAWCFEDHRRLVENLVRRYHRPVVEVAGLAGRGEIVVRSAGDRLIVHVLNYNGTVRPFAEIAPLTGVTVTAVGKTAGRVRALHAKKVLAARQVRAGCKVRLGKLDLAETLVFDLVERKPARWTVRQGDILDCPADVLICSANVHLELSGGVGAAIRERFGDAMQDELHAQLARRRRKFVDPGDVVETPPAGTPFAAVLHAVAVDAFHESTVQVVRAVARESLRRAASLGARRVALTALATGYGSLNMREFAEAVAPLVTEAFPPIEQVTVCVRNQHHADELAAALPGDV